MIAKLIFIWQSTENNKFNLLFSVLWQIKTTATIIADKGFEMICFP